MIIFYLILALTISIGAVVFALQNSEPVTVTLFAWTVTGSLSLVLLVTLLSGLLIGLLVVLPGTIRRNFQVSGLKKTIQKLSSAPTASSQESTGVTEKAEQGSSG